MIIEKLLDKIKSKNIKAQKEFYYKYAAHMYNVAYRYVNNEIDAGSIVNYAFFKIFENINGFTYNNEKSLIAWMKKIVANESLGYIRKRIEFDEITDNRIEAHVTVPESSLDLEAYYKLIEELPDDYKTVFNLYAIEGFSHEEISKSLNIKASSSRVYLTRARKLLQEKITNHER